MYREILATKKIKKICYFHLKTRSIFPKLNAAGYQVVQNAVLSPRLYDYKNSKIRKTAHYNAIKFSKI